MENFEKVNVLENGDSTDDGNEYDGYQYKDTSLAQEEALLNKLQLLSVGLSQAKTKEILDLVLLCQTLPFLKEFELPKVPRTIMTRGTYGVTCLLDEPNRLLIGIT